LYQQSLVMEYLQIQEDSRELEVELGELGELVVLQ
jgi:hypothetical protein